MILKDEYYLKNNAIKIIAKIIVFYIIVIVQNIAFDID